MFTKEKKEEPRNTKAENKPKNSPNLTGIPDDLKTSFESFSGFSFNDVKVHYNSDKPAQLQALAYTMGNQVYVGPGQERHLGHELGHVVQQKRGVIPPTRVVAGVAINDDPALEQQSGEYAQAAIRYASPIQTVQLQAPSSAVVQMVGPEARAKPHLKAPESPIGWTDDITAHHIFPVEKFTGFAGMREEFMSKIKNEFESLKDLQDGYVLSAKDVDGAIKNVQESISKNENMRGILTRWYDLRRLLTCHFTFADSNSAQFGTMFDELEKSTIGAFDPNEHEKNDITREAISVAKVKLNTHIARIEKMRAKVAKLTGKEKTAWGELQGVHGIEFALNNAAAPTSLEGFSSNNLALDDLVTLRHWPKGNLFYGPKSETRIEPGAKDGFDSDVTFVLAHRLERLDRSLADAEAEKAQLEIRLEVLKSAMNENKTARDNAAAKWGEYKHRRQKRPEWREYEHRYINAEDRWQDSKRRYETAQEALGVFNERLEALRVQTQADREKIVADQARMAELSQIYNETTSKISVTKGLATTDEDLELFAEMSPYERLMDLGALFKRVYELTAKEESIPMDATDWRQITAADAPIIAADRKDGVSGRTVADKSAFARDKWIIKDALPQHPAPIAPH